MLVNAKSEIFQLYHDENKLLFDWMIMTLAWYILSWIFTVLTYWNNTSQIAMSLNSSTLFWLGANESLVFLLYVACLA